MRDDFPHRDGEQEAGLLRSTPSSLDKPIFAILINFAVIICNIATFWLVTSNAPVALLMSMRIINNLFSVAGIGIGLASLPMGWSSLHDPSNRITFSLFCGMNIVVAAGTFA